MIANGALTAVCELVENFLATLFKALRLLGEELGSDMSSADILRVVLKQASVASLFDLEAQMTEVRANTDRFKHLLGMLSERVAAVNSEVLLEGYLEDADAPAEDDQTTEANDAVNDEELEDELNTETSAAAAAPPEDYDFE